MTPRLREANGGHRWRRTAEKLSKPPQVLCSCPERGTGAALVLPACNSEAMQLHLDEIATKVTPSAHAIVLLDQAAGMALAGNLVPVRS